MDDFTVLESGRKPGRGAVCKAEQRTEVYYSYYTEAGGRDEQIATVTQEKLEMIL